MLAVWVVQVPRGQHRSAVERKPAELVGAVELAGAALALEVHKVELVPAELVELAVLVQVEPGELAEPVPAPVLHKAVTGPVVQVQAQPLQVVVLQLAGVLYMVATYLLAGVLKRYVPMVT